MCRVYKALNVYEDYHKWWIGLKVLSLYCLMITGTNQEYLQQEYHVLRLKFESEMALVHIKQLSTLLASLVP